MYIATEFVIIFIAINALKVNQSNNYESCVAYIYFMIAHVKKQYNV